MSDTRRGAAARTAEPIGDEDRPWTCGGASFATIYADHSAAVFDVARRIGIPHLASDVTQDVFVALWRDPARFRPERGSLRGFLVMVARNLAIDRARSDTARRGRELRESRSHPGAAVDEAAGLLAAEEVDEISMALARLEAGSREAIVAAFYGGLSYAEVAIVLGTPEGTVKSRIRRGLQQLRAELPELAPGGRAS